MSLRDAKNPPELTKKAFARFVGYIDRRADGHWIWTGGTNSKGYGRFWFNGQVYYSHRVSYRMFKGSIPHRVTVGHKPLCNIPSCICPSHLGLESHRHNTAEGNTRRRRPRMEYPT